MSSLDITPRRRGCVGHASKPSQDVASVSAAFPMDANFHRLEIRVQAIQLSPYHAGPSAHRPWQLSPVTDCLACSGPHHLSDPGKPSGPGISLQFLPAEPGIQQGASWRTCSVRRCCATCRPRGRRRAGGCRGGPCACGWRSGPRAAGSPPGCCACAGALGWLSTRGPVRQDHEGPDARSADRSGHARVAMTCSTAGASPAWPGVRTKRSGRQRPLATRWILVLRPPRERPIAWWSGSSAGAPFGRPRPRSGARARRSSRPRRLGPDHPRRRSGRAVR